MSPVLEFPQIAVFATKVFVLAWRCLIVLFVHVVDRIPQSVVIGALSPSKVVDYIIHTFFARMAYGLEGIASDAAEA